jgi:hypothetical protein
MRIEEFLGRPKLLRGEDRQLYRMLLKEVTRLWEPDNLFDQLEVQEITTNIWEASRFQKLQAELINAEHSNAIRKLADPKLGYVSEQDAKRVKLNAELPVEAGMSEGMLFKKLNLTAGLVRAASVALTGNSLLVFDRLIANRRAARKGAQKEYDRRKRLAAKDERLAAREKRSRIKDKRLANDNKPAVFSASAEPQNDWVDTPSRRKSS